MPDPIDCLNNDYAELLENTFSSILKEPLIYTAETHARISSLRRSISDELGRRSMDPLEEKRRSWRFQSIDSEYRFQLFQGYIDDMVKVEPVLLRDPSVERLLTLDIIG